MRQRILLAVLEHDQWWRRVLGKDFTSWFSCVSCHGVAYGSQQGAAGHVRQYMRGFSRDREVQDGSLSCQMAGKRTPEVVWGRHLDHIRERQMAPP